MSAPKFPTVVLVFSNFFLCGARGGGDLEGLLDLFSTPKMARQRIFDELLFAHSRRE